MGAGHLAGALGPEGWTLEVDPEMADEHREIFFPYSWVDYTTHRPGRFRLVPPEKHLPAWRDDYEKMRGPMLFGETPSFDEILAVVGEFERRFNRPSQTV